MLLADSRTCCDGVLELRRLRTTLDGAIRDAYGWHDLELGHGFHEVETLPENDRVRCTISTIARRDVIKRLLAENYARINTQGGNTQLPHTGV